MVKTVLSMNRQGLRDWIVQRLSAVYMAVYLLSFTVFLFTQSSMSFIEWRGVFAGFFMKVATILFILAVLYHAWIGIWTVFTDYVKPTALRAILNTLVLLLLFACFFWGVLILGSV
jgi:succinate dehydrogenase / fumarate reductase, membrane anchor subunit